MTRQPTNATAPGTAQTSRVAHSDGDAAGVVAPHHDGMRQNARMAIDASPTTFRLPAAPSAVYDPIADLVRRYDKHGAEIALRPAEPNAINRAAARRAKRNSWSKSR